MKLPPLTRGRILSRYKRFLADIELENGEVVTAHCANTGAMTGCWEPGAPAELSYSNNPKRKLAWTLERVDMGHGWVGVNTSRVNQVVASLVEAGRVPGIDHYQSVQREPTYSAPGFPRSRFDLLLRRATLADCYVEVKNTTLWQDGMMQFPDAVTERGRKHLTLLAHAAARGNRSIILFAVNRPEGDAVRAAGQIDPAYAETLRQVVTEGVETLAVRLRHTPKGITMGGVLPVLLE